MFDVGLTSLVIGMVLGIVSSVPPGPINLAVMQFSHSNRRVDRQWFVLGVILADVLVAALALLGMLTAHLSNEILRGIGLVGGSAFLLYGIIGLCRKAKTLELSEPKEIRPTKNFVAGLLLCGLNPGFYLFWIYGSSLLLSWNQIGWTSALFFLIGIFCGDTLWFQLLSRTVERFRDRIRIETLRSGSFLLIAFFGAYALWRSFNGSFEVS